jgi:hypothetical protein
VKAEVKAEMKAKKKTEGEAEMKTEVKDEAPRKKRYRGDGEAAPARLQVNTGNSKNIRRSPAKKTSRLLMCACVWRGGWGPHPPKAQLMQDSLDCVEVQNELLQHLQKQAAPTVHAARPKSKPKAKQKPAAPSPFYGRFRVYSFGDKNCEHLGFKNMWTDKKRRELLGDDNAILINFNRDDMPHLFDDLQKGYHTGMHIDAQKALLGPAFQKYLQEECRGLVAKLTKLKQECG